MLLEVYHARRAIAPPPDEDLALDQTFVPGLQHHHTPLQPVDQLGFQLSEIPVFLVDDGYEPVDLNVHL